jgi:hypothetical protein
LRVIVLRNKMGLSQRFLCSNQMLEHRQLSLQMRSIHGRPAGDASGRVLLDIVEPTSKAPLGTVRSSRLPRRWWFWPSRECLKVYEHEDEPLLFSVHRLWTWPRAWEIRDADETPVGRIQKGLIISWRSPIPEVYTSTQGNGLLFLSSLGNQLGSLAKEREGCTLTFNEGLREDPFTKMLLLGAALAWKV